MEGWKERIEFWRQLGPEPGSYADVMIKAYDEGYQLGLREGFIIGIQEGLSELGEPPMSNEDIAWLETIEDYYELKMAAAQLIKSRSRQLGEEQ